MSNELTIPPLPRVDNAPTGIAGSVEPDVGVGMQPIDDSGKQAVSPDQGRALAVSRAELDTAVEELNRHMQSRRSELSFSLDDDSGVTVMRVTDMDREVVIRQIPSDETLAILRMLQQGDTKGALLRLNV